MRIPRTFWPPQRRRSRLLLLLALAATAAVAVVFIPSAGADSVKAQTFELDGNVAQNHPAAPTTYDWANFFNSAGAKITPLPSGYTASTFVRDFNTNADGSFNTNDGSTFTIGSKDILDVSGWSCTPANNVTDKGDIMNAYATTYTAADGHKFAYFALERNANTGDANVAFWFLQGGASCPAAGGSFVGNHHDGDLLVVSAFTKGGVVSTIDAYRWNGNGTTGSLGTTPVAHGADCSSSTASADPTCATSNTAAVTNIPWLTENKTDGVGHSLQSGEFFEGGIDLTPLGLGNDCFNTFMADTRSSQSLTATLYDYALGNLGECHSTTSTTPVDASDHTKAPATSIPLAPNDAKVTVQDQTVIGTTGAPSSFNSSNATNLSWHICGPTAPASTQLCDGTTGNVGVSVGSTAITAAGTFYSPTVTLTEAGRYCFRADFAGDSTIGLPGSSDSGANECFTIAPVQPTLSTTATPVVEIGSPIDDTAHLGGTAKEQGTGGPSGSDGSINPGTLGGPAKGTITFKLFGPSSSATCNTAIATRVVNVSGNGDYTASSGTGSGSLTPTSSGAYYWTASYSGDSPNTLGASGQCGDSNETSRIVDANISISPNGVNPVGHAHTFTITTTALPAGTTATLTSITPHISPTPDSESDTCSTPTLGTNTASCTVTINNNSPGTFTATATAVWHFSDGTNSVDVTRSTDSTHGSSGPATKTFVNANISISPNGVNEVGHSHTFTITTNASPASGSTATLTSITPHVSPAPDSESDTCSTPTVGTNTASCTVTISNNSAGTFTATATSVWHFSDGTNSTDVTSTTDSTGSNSGPATKRFVDANVSISPSGVNEVGHSHTFTISSTASPSGSTATLTSITPQVSPTPDSESDTCAAPTVSGNTATCTVTISNNTAGVFTADATAVWHFSDGTNSTDVTRSTSGNSGPGGSGSATKRFVDANVSISPNGVNEVGNAHTFTITTNALPAGSTATLTSITPNISPAPTSESDTCSTPTLGTNSASCTVTINSSSAGVFTADATAVWHFSDGTNSTDVTRSTSGNSGPGGSGSATKRFVDANVSISPDATNGITEQHVFTITTNASPAGSTASLTSITPHVSPAPTSESDTCGSPTIGTNTASCTVTINSNSAGTFTATATAVWHFTDGTNSTDVTRATDSTHGSSGAATKVYVQGSLSWIKHDGSGNLLGGATFQVCATAGTAASSGHTPLCVTVVDNVGQAGYTGADSDPTPGQFTLNAYQSFGGSALGGLALGTYTITETVPPAGFTLDPFVESITITKTNLNPSATHVWVDTNPGQGCTPGFWKNHTGAWNSTSDSTVSHLLPFLTSPFGYNAAVSNFNNQPFFRYGTSPFSPGIFGLPAGPFQSLSSTLTLIGALNLGGGGFQALARHGTAGLLSSGSVKYPYTPTQVLNGVRNAFLSGNANQVSTTFPDGVLTDIENANNLNEQACPTG